MATMGEPGESTANGARGRRPRSIIGNDASPSNGEAPTGAGSRWRSESRTVRPSYDDSRSRSRSVAHPFNKRYRSQSKAPAQQPNANGNANGKADGNGNGGGPNGSGDVEKGNAAGAPSKVSLWQRYQQWKRPKSPLEPLLRLIPMWLEGYIWGWIGGFVGLGCAILVFTRINAFTNSTGVPVGDWTAPPITGSFGASAVLLYAMPASPLSQPRSFFFGQVFSAVVGVCVTKLFAISSHFDVSSTNHSYSLVWVAGAVATGTAILVQQATRTIHPPGGATAVLAATSMPIVRLGWRYIPVVMLTCAIMLAWAVLWMNAGRKSYPQWWFFPPEETRKQAFPGPELGAYGRKVRQAMKRRRGRGSSQKGNEGVLPTATSNNAGINGEAGGKSSGVGENRGSGANDGDANHRAPDGHREADEWQDQSDWTAAQAQQQQQPQQPQDVEEERQSRWSRPDAQ